MNSANAVIQFGAIITILSLAVSPLKATVNVYFSNTAPTSLQTDFLSNSTSQFTGTVMPSHYLPNTYDFNITGKQANPPMTTCPPRSTIDTQLAIATTTLAALATDYYLSGWVNGQAYERYSNISWIDSYVACSTSAFTAPLGVSTSTWKVPKIDTTTCSFMLGYIANNIYQQNFSSPTIVPGF